jgi:hypothetical protein
MPSPLFDGFLGHDVDRAGSPFNSAMAGQNFVIHRRRNPKNSKEGYIELADGYAKKFSALPVNDTTIRRLSDIAYEDIYNLWIPEHGGRNVTVVAATYRKSGFFWQGISGSAWSVSGGSLTKVTGAGTAFLTELVVGQHVLFDSTPKIVLSITNNTELFVTVAFGGATSGTAVASAPYIERFGIFIRPYWNGSSWVDEWFETTEMFIFTLKALGSYATTRLYIDDGTFNFNTLDPGATVFTTDYFKNWSIVYGAFGDNENYDIVKASGFGSEFVANSYYLDLIHVNTDFSTRTPGTKLLVYRSFQTAELSSTLSSFIYGLLSEARLTSGNTASDRSLMLGNRTKSFIATHSGYTLPTHTRTVDGVIADIGCPEIWAYAVCLGIRVQNAATDPVPAGTYTLRYSLVLDDGTESRLFGAWTAAGSATHEWDTLTLGGSVTLTTGQGIRVNGLFSFGALPIRAKYLRVYMTDDVVYYRVVDLDLNDASTWGQTYASPLPVTINGTIKHFFAVSIDTDITNAMWTASTGDSGTDAVTQIGRSIDDDGVVQFKAAAVVGRTCFTIGVRKDGTLYPNHIFASLQNGDGAPQYDAFGLVAENMIDLEYNDGDELMFGYPAGDTLLAFKRRSVIKVSQGSSGNAVVFIRDFVTKADGLCSSRTVVGFEDVIYWAGYNGVYSFSSQGIQVLNFNWLNEWKAIIDTYKEEAVAIFDRTNRQYRLAYQTGASTYAERILDVDTGEWVLSALTDQPERFAADQKGGTVDFLSGSLIQTLGAGTLHDGSNFIMEYMTNDLLASQNQIADALLLDVRVKYQSDVALSLTLYRDGVPQSAVVAAAGNGSVLISAGLSYRCKNFRLKIIAVTTDVNQSVKIKEICPRYQMIPAGVTRPSFASEGAAAAIDQRPMTLADVRSGTCNLVAGVLTTVTFTTPYSVAVGTGYSLKADVFDVNGNWIMSAEAKNQTRYGFDITSPEDGYVRYVAASYQ